jgi:hypothetical protein
MLGLVYDELLPPVDATVAVNVDNNNENNQEVIIVSPAFQVYPRRELLDFELFLTDEIENSNDSFDNIRAQNENRNKD